MRPPVRGGRGHGAAGGPGPEGALPRLSLIHILFPTGILLFPALYAAAKIAAGVLVLYFGKRYVKKRMEEEKP